MLVFFSRNVIIKTCCLILLVCIIQSCGNDEKKGINSNENNIVQESSKLAITSPKNNDKFISGDDIEIAISLSDASIKLDSVVYFCTEKRIGQGNNLKWKSTGSRVGYLKIAAKAYHSGNKFESAEIMVLILSDIKPAEYSYKVLNTYNHDPAAYTQGLVCDGDILYEGTGEWGTSSLRKVNLKTGEILKSVNLSQDIFGEGIAISKNKIVQLTWQSNFGFIYDKESFKQIGKFNYSTEGWGIAFDGKNFVMSDGSSRLYYLEPETMTQVSQIEVCDNNGQIGQLNELEVIDGEIWANVYQEDFIVVIDPLTGKVTKKINLDGILNLTIYDRKVDVLNGIAYDAVKRRIFVTGKWWPTLYEIEVVKK